MTTASISALIRRRTAACLLVLVALGQLAAGAHALEHGIADQPDRCATCVHFDQGSQVPSSAKALALQSYAAVPATFVSTGSVPHTPAAHFDARAPPE